MNQPHTDCQHGPDKERLQGLLMDLDKKVRNMVKRPFVRAADVAVLDLIGEVLKRIYARQAPRASLEPFVGPRSFGHPYKA